VTEAARRLGITRQTLNNVFNKKSAISPEIALRFEKIEMGYGGRLNDPANEL
jgi:plasmid maintenance system antidote protein VapI